MRRLTLVALAAAVAFPAFGGFRVSSFKRETSVQLGDQFWNVASALDGKMETAWMIDPEEENKGSWIEVDLPKSKVDKIKVVNGFAKNDESFKDFARVKSMRIEVYTETDDGQQLVKDETITFEDKNGWQTVEIANSEVGGELFGGKVRATVTDVYPGADYPNLAMSEFMVMLEEIDAATVFAEEPAGAEGHDAMNMIDDSAKTFWASDGNGAGTSFQLEAAGFGVSSLGIQPGPKTHARPKTIKVGIANTERTYTLADKQDMQWFELPAITGYSGSAWGEATIEIVDTYPGDNPSVAIAEAKLRATNFEGI